MQAPEGLKEMRRMRLRFRPRERLEERQGSGGFLNSNRGESELGARNVGFIIGWYLPFRLIAISPAFLSNLLWKNQLNHRATALERDGEFEDSIFKL